MVYIVCIVFINNTQYKKTGMYLPPYCFSYIPLCNIKYYSYLIPYVILLSYTLAENQDAPQMSPVYGTVCEVYSWLQVLQWVCTLVHYLIIVLTCYPNSHFFGMSGDRSYIFPSSVVYVQAFRSYLLARQHATAAKRRIQTRANSIIFLHTRIRAPPTNLHVT